MRTERVHGVVAGFVPPFSPPPSWLGPSPQPDELSMKAVTQLRASQYANCRTRICNEGLVNRASQIPLFLAPFVCRVLDEIPVDILQKSPTYVLRLVTISKLILKPSKI